MSLPAYLRAVDGGVELAVRVTPKAGRDALAGVFHDAAGAAWLSVKVCETAEAGRANRAAIQVLARECGVARSAVGLVAGATSRWKRLVVAGNAEALARRLGEAAGEPVA